MEADSFLKSRGWTKAVNLDEWSHLYKHLGGSFSWEQAIALEFMEFITVGGPVQR